MYTEGIKVQQKSWQIKLWQIIHQSPNLPRFLIVKFFYYSTITLSPSTCVLEYHIAHKIQRHTKHDQHRHKHKHTTQTQTYNTNTQSTNKYSIQAYTLQCRCIGDFLYQSEDFECYFTGRRKLLPRHTDLR